MQRRIEGFIWPEWVTAVGDKSKAETHFPLGRWRAR
jgi:hypothetical protein